MQQPTSFSAAINPAAALAPQIRVLETERASTEQRIEAGIGDTNVVTLTRPPSAEPQPQARSPSSKGGRAGTSAISLSPNGISNNCIRTLIDLPV
jgi:hypothetical protein